MIVHSPIFPDTLAGAIAFFNDDADQRVVDHVAKLLASGEARWQADPEVRSVYGLMIPGTNNALVVVYAPDLQDDPTERWDWEMSDKLLRMLP
jgi:hypothetical protein